MIEFHQVLAGRHTLASYQRGRGSGSFNRKIGWAGVKLVHTSAPRCRWGSAALVGGAAAGHPIQPWRLHAAHKHPCGHAGAEADVLVHRQVG